MTGAAFLMVEEAVLESEYLLHYSLLPNLPKVTFHNTLQIKHIAFDSHIHTNVNQDYHGVMFINLCRKIKSNTCPQGRGWSS